MASRNLLFGPLERWRARGVDCGPREWESIDSEYRDQCAVNGDEARARTIGRAGADIVKEIKTRLLSI